MAITKILNIMESEGRNPASHLKNALEYIQNPDKTEECVAEMSESAGESRKTIQRLIYLSNLTEELLELIDNKKIGIAQGVDLAFISKEEQEVVFRVMQKTGVFINMEQSARIKNAVKDGLFNEQWLLEILSYKKPPVRKVVFNQNKLDSYFEPNMTNEDIEGIIVKLLEEWKMKGGQV